MIHRWEQGLAYRGALGRASVPYFFSLNAERGAAAEGQRWMPLI